MPQYKVTFDAVIDHDSDRLDGITIDDILREARALISQDIYSPWWITREVD